MHDDLIATYLPGASSVLDWFGHWPSFHDAEVIELQLRRVGASTVAIHVFSTQKEINSSGLYQTDHHAIVTFTLGEILAMSLSHFNHQNVLSDLLINRADERYELIFGGCYGLQGHLVTDQLAVSLIPGLPNQSVYDEAL